MGNVTGFCPFDGAAESVVQSVPLKAALGLENPRFVGMICWVFISLLTSPVRIRRIKSANNVKAKRENC